MAIKTSVIQGEVQKAYIFVASLQRQEQQSIMVTKIESVTMTGANKMMEITIKFLICILESWAVLLQRIDIIFNLQIQNMHLNLKDLRLRLYSSQQNK